MTSQQTRPLEGKTVLITGAARRVGAALARSFHAAGANVVLHYHNSAEEAAQLAGELEGARPGLDCDRAERSAGRVALRAADRGHDAPRSVSSIS